MTPLNLHNLLPSRASRQGWGRGITRLEWLNFFFPILQRFCPLAPFVQIAQMDLIFPGWGLILPRILPLFFTQAFLGICRYLKHPQPHSKTPPFLSWTWKWAKQTTVWAKWTPTGQNVWKVGNSCLEVGKKKLFIRLESFLGGVRPILMACQRVAYGQIIMVPSSP